MCLPRLFFISVIVPIQISFTAPPASLVQLNILYRHGDRSPTGVYPKDINRAEVAWPDGLGWLTNIGKAQQYELGQYLKFKYDGFLTTSHYNHSEIQIQSSAVDRCLMSAYCNLAGLFPPLGDQEWYPQIWWQPIPVQTLPQKLDNKLAMGAPCPRYDQLMKEVLNSPEIRKEEEENKEFYEFVEEQTGVLQESIRDIWQVIDTLVCEQAHNLTWNSWVNSSVWSKLSQLKSQSFDILVANSEMAKLKGGPLLSEIIQNMVDASSRRSLPKVQMYSAHDSTVTALLSAMNVYNGIAPMYRSLVLVELHQINATFQVKVLYKNDSTRDPLELSVPGCVPVCTLDKFILATKDHVPVNWTAECAAHALYSSSDSLTPASWISLTIGISLCIAVAVAIIIMTIRLHYKKSPNYIKL